MYRALHLVPVILLVAAPVAAQDVIRPGESVSGRLTGSDPMLEDGSHYDVWRFAGVARHRYRVTLRSDDFDAYLSVGSNALGECGDCASDDDGAGGGDALVEFTGPADGTFQIRANSYDGGQMGEYQLTLEDVGVAEEHQGHDDAAPDVGAQITLGEVVTGTLARGDRKMDNSYTDTWTYNGREGETIRVTLRSEDFDTYVALGEYESGECRGMDGDDDSGGGTDSQITAELPDDGAFHIHVRSASQGGIGAYTLLVEQVTDRESGVPPMPISPGETLNERLWSTDTQEADGSYRDAWTFMGQVGDTYVITLRSEEFDTFLQVGRMSGDEWDPLMTDDDGAGEGTDSQITITLPMNGQYVIRAGAYEPNETGAYTLSLERR
jgi:hypothetical protein